MQSLKTIYDFQDNESVSDWQVINDNVMGGLSKGNLSLNENGHAFFSGSVSTANNGGFSSIRHSFQEPVNVSGHEYFVLRILGDGKQYQFRIKHNRYDNHSYIAYFETSGEWEEIKVSMKKMFPSFRGFELDMENFNGDQISEVGILIGNKKSEDFKLVIDRISIQ